MTREEQKQWIIDRDREYRSGNTTVSDPEYDEVYYDFVKKYPDDEDITLDGVIEQPLEDAELLPIKMYSLEKEHSIDEIKTWCRNKGIPEDTIFTATGKYDGLSLCTRELIIKCWTRGKGIYGEIKDEHFLIIKTGKTAAEFITDNDVTYGECIITKKDWKENFEGKLNPRDGKPFKAARNTIAGQINTKKSINQELLKYGTYVRYGIESIEGSHMNKSDQLDLVNQMNEIPVHYELMNMDDFTLENFNNLYNKISETFEIDGLVIEIDDYNLREELGRERNNNPAYARALKLPEWSTKVKVPCLSLRLGVSKQGKIKPVAQIEPTIITNVEVSNFTCYNMNYVFENNIAAGSFVEITRSGDVIPKHLKTFTHNQSEIDKLREQLKKCPCCGSDTYWDDTHTELMCNNLKCPERLLNKQISFFTNIKIDNFGEKEIEKLFNAGYDTPKKLLEITYDELYKFDGWADKSITKLLSQFDKLHREGLPLAKIIHALDLFEGKLGEKDSQRIFDNFKGDFDDPNIIEQLCEIEGIGEIKAKAFYVGLKEYNLYHQDLPIKVSYAESPKMELKSNKYEGFNICMTGFRDAELAKMIKENGGVYTDGVSKKTTHLLVKDKNSGSGKLEKATNMGIPILYKEEFLENY
jgi:NAD-dependent DNA ligase